MSGEQLEFSWTFSGSLKAGRMSEAPHAGKWSGRQNRFEPVMIVRRPTGPHELQPVPAK